MNSDAQIGEDRKVRQSAGGLAEFLQWLLALRGDLAASLVVAIEVPHGAVVEVLLEHGFEVFSINPKQLDRFRDRYFPAGAKDDGRDAFVLADSLRTDRHCFRAVRVSAILGSSACVNSLASTRN